MIFTSLPVAAFAEDTYVIEEGDMLWEIAEKYGKTIEEIAEYNNIDDPNKIYPGTKLNIPGGEAGTPKEVLPEGVKKISILGTADLHGRIYSYEYAIDAVDKDAGLAKIQTLVKEVRATEENVILMDVGDTVQDNSAELFNDLPVHPMVQAMNEMDFDIWAIGNHEFNFEKSFLERNLAAFEGKALSANIYKEGTNERFIDGHTVMTIDGVRVAIIGMIPPHVPIWEASAPSHFAGLEFTDIKEETAKAVKELEGKYDVLVGAYHLGPEAYKGMPGIEDIAEAFPQFDVIFGGHAHSKYMNEVNGVKLIEPGKYGWALAKADIYVDAKSGSYEVTEVKTANMETYTVAEDQGILDTFKFVHDKSVADAKTVVGEVTTDYVEKVDYITGKAEVTTMPTTQIEDTALIDLINDVQLFYAKSQISSAAAFKTDMNLVKGDFMKKDVANIYKYPNTLVGVNITGENLLKYMEWSASYYNTYTEGDVTISFNPNIRGYNYDMFAGLTYDIDLSKEAGERITNVKFEEKEIDPKATYKLAVNNYRFGTLTSLDLVTDADKYYDSYEAMQDAGRIRDLIIKYIGEEKAGKATPEVDNNWKIINADLEQPGKAEIIQAIIDEKILIPRSEDGRTPNVKAINIHDKEVYELIDGTTFKDAKELVIMHTNDMHGFFKYGKYDGMGAALMATKIKDIRANNKNTLLLDGGDALQGHNLVTLSKGATGVKVLNLLAYDAMAAGNHEFDYGSDRLTELKDMLEVPVLAANVLNEDGTDFLTPYIIKEIDGMKVAIFGLSTPETTYKSHPNNTKGLFIQDPAVVAQAMVRELEGKADVIIALAHVGNEGDFTTEKIAKAAPGIDLIIDGHSHSEYPNGLYVGDTLIVQAEEKTKNLGIAKLMIMDGKVVNKTAYMFTKSEAADLTPDAEMEKLIEELDAINAPIELEVVATAPYKLDGERADVRTGETTLGNMIAEALLWVSNADVALTNGGGIRASIDAGEVTKGEIKTAFPFGNTVRMLELSGADIIAALENGLTDYPEAKGAFPHIAGMTVKFDASKEAGSRVVEVMIAGKALVETQNYKLVTNDFLTYGGDAYEMFEGKKIIGEYGAMDEVLIDYMNEKGFEKAPVIDRIKDISNETSYIVLDLVA
jgi:2',3'-cyclic-nucleotide 2'-phosphodiesterase (5'-nucleotidase family)